MLAIITAVLDDWWNRYGCTQNALRAGSNLIPKTVFSGQEHMCQHIYRIYSGVNGIISLTTLKAGVVKHVVCISGYNFFFYFQIRPPVIRIWFGCTHQNSEPRGEHNHSSQAVSAPHRLMGFVWPLHLLHWPEASSSRSHVLITMNVPVSCIRQEFDRHYEVRLYVWLTWQSYLMVTLSWQLLWVMFMSYYLRPFWE